MSSTTKEAEGSSWSKAEKKFEKWVCCELSSPCKYSHTISVYTAFYEHSQTYFQSSPSFCLQAYPSHQSRFIFPLPPPGTHYHPIAPRRRPILNGHGMFTASPKQSTKTDESMVLRLYTASSWLTLFSIDHMPFAIDPLFFRFDWQRLFLFLV